MVIEIEMGVLVSVAMAVVAAWWAVAVLAIRQFEGRQEQRFEALGSTMSSQKTELDEHLKRQDFAMSEIRRVEGELARCQIEAANRYMTKEDAKNRHQEILDAIHSLGSRIDMLHGRNGTQ